jgi:hypothetical protein
MPDERPRKNEDEFFTRQDAELIKGLRAKLDQDRIKAERSSHFMKCPKCGADLEEKAHGDVKIDVCPECHGIWLDAGEMDLISRAADAGGSPFVNDLLGFFQRKKK